MDLLNKKKCKRLQIEIEDVKKHNKVLEDRIAYLNQQVAELEKTKNIVVPTLDVRSFAKRLKKAACIKTFGCNRYYMFSVRVLDDIINSSISLGDVKEIYFDNLRAIVTLITNVELQDCDILMINGYRYYLLNFQKVENKTVCLLQALTHDVDVLFKINDIEVGNKVYLT